jgi:hypothetical protein
VSAGLIVAYKIRGVKAVSTEDQGKPMTLGLEQQPESSKKEAPFQGLFNLPGGDKARKRNGYIIT